MTMLKIEIDGSELEVPHGSTVMDAVNKIGTYVPHFCYHRKLSIAANCRMCLVEVEKAPKPLPACATPVTDGMKVRTASMAAKNAQNGVMEFLLINHPLDCPICDQGGECQLQDLAVGYGKSESRYQEEKRVVFAKNLGPLVAAEEMSRCIQCTRCVRFGAEIAGTMELGMINRGEHSEIVSFVGQTVDSELSGNMIDLCPVGALTSKPFRYAARTWELARRRSVSPHDGVGANLVVQVKQNKVLRVLPLENEEVNECWISDRDRFSYEALNGDDRLLKPMIRRDGRLQESDWEVALSEAAAGLRQAGASFGILAGSSSTLEEFHLASRLARSLNGAADFRLRQADFSADGKREGIPWLGMPIVELQRLDRILLVGSFLRHDQPLLAHRLRQAAKAGARICVLHSADDDLLMPVAHRKIVRPSDIVAALDDLTEGEIAQTMRSGGNAAIILGNFALQHPDAAQIHVRAESLAKRWNARLGVLGDAANAIGGYLAGLPIGESAGSMMEAPRRAYLLLNTEPELDAANPASALGALRSADFVVSLSPFLNGAEDYAHVLLPAAAFTETSGTFFNCEGRMQGFEAAVRPPGDARPAWKILRQLGTLMGLPGFDFDRSEQVRDACLAGRNVSTLLSNATSMPALTVDSAQTQAIQRVADVPIYFSDGLARRSPPLRKTRQSRQPKALMNAGLLRAIGMVPGGRVRVTSASGSVDIVAGLDNGLPDGCVRLPAGHPSTAALGSMFGEISIERADGGEGAR
jgi:NADH-quinone oxidoreductase subunit G